MSSAAAYAEFAALYPESGGGYRYVANVFDTDLTDRVGGTMIPGAVPESVVEAARSPLLVVRRHRGIVPRFRRWFRWR